MEPLKEMFNHAFYKKFANTFAAVYPSFQTERFFKDVTRGLANRELNERLRHTALTLRNYLPVGFLEALAIMKDAAPRLDHGYTALVLPDYVALFGREHKHESLEALKYFTTFGSSEFAVREFFILDFDTTLRYMENWASDENHHVRRLASEGSRPRLPWSFRLERIMKDPSLTRKILEQLKTDDHLYVRKSVANHLNDISKDHPKYLLQLVSSWNLLHPHTAWIVKHGCRTLIKNGEADILKLFSFHHDASFKLEKHTLSHRRIGLGDELEFSIKLRNTDGQAHRFAIDYAIHYCRPSKKWSRKVFKWKEVLLEKNASVSLAKKQLFRDFTTRKHYSGNHFVEVLVNGRSISRKSFHLQVPSGKFSE
jgi:3-methyladenine DNA glycosylase AlkC